MDILKTIGAGAVQAIDTFFLGGAITDSVNENAISKLTKAYGLTYAQAVKLYNTVQQLRDKEQLTLEQIRARVATMPWFSQTKHRLEQEADRKEQYVEQLNKQVDNAEDRVRQFEDERGKSLVSRYFNG